ncbi:MAG: AAA family ATPase [Blastocatellia bacterium]
MFAARDQELDRASVTVFDAPRNLLIYGLFGIGKTVFIEALMRDLRETHGDRVLCVSECLDGVDSDIKTTILRGLAKALRSEDDDANEIHQLLSGVELTTQQINKASGVGEVSIPGILKAGGGGEESITESWARKLVPNAAYQIRELIDRAMNRRPERRIIIAVDDLDKRDPETVRANLADARGTLHNECSFIFTGHPLGILRQGYSSVGGIFDLQLELKILADGSMQRLMVNYLEAGRRDDATEQGIFPFFRRCGAYRHQTVIWYSACAQCDLPECVAGGRRDAQSFD